jgi:lysophospholipase L1-like esterase
LPGKVFLSFAGRTLVLAALLGGFVLPAPVRAETKSHPCNVTSDQVRLAHPLKRVSHRIAAGLPITIVAIGSSSTAGAGASSPAMNYPNRLAAELTQHFPRQPITVVNRGVNGEEARDMIARFDQSVLAEKPDLVLWQVGTNSVLRDHPLAPHGAMIHEGISRLRSFGADVILIDPQFAPKVIAKPDAEGMVNLIATAAKQENVDLFRRFALMRKWREVEGVPFETFVSPDGLHMNDWSYGCVAKALGVAIAEAATRPVTSASAGQ